MATVDLQMKLSNDTQIFLKVENDWVILDPEYKVKIPMDDWGTFTILISQAIELQQDIKRAEK